MLADRFAGVAHGRARDAGRPAVPRIVISGAAHGLGAACARLLAARGAELLLADIDGPALSRVVEELGCEGRFCDVASESSVEIFAHALVAKGRVFDVLINLAGPAYVRSLGLLRLSATLLPCLSNGGRPSLIVNAASASASKTAGHGFDYASSGDAFRRLSTALGQKLAPRGIVTRTILRDSTADTGQVAAEVVARIAAIFPLSSPVAVGPTAPDRRMA